VKVTELLSQFKLALEALPPFPVPCISSVPALEFYHNLRTEFDRRVEYAKTFFDSRAGLK